MIPIPVLMIAAYAGYKAMSRTLDDNGSVIRKHVTKPAKEELGRIIQGMSAFSREARLDAEARLKEGTTTTTVNQSRTDSLSN